MDYGHARLFSSLLLAAASHEPYPSMLYLYIWAVLY
jgi:hypothetical protein